MNEARIEAAANALIGARVSNEKPDVSRLPQAPESLDEVYAIQARVRAHTGPVGGWKIGAPSPQAQATFAPLPRSGVLASGTALIDDSQRMRGIEVEVAYRLANDLPARHLDYTAAEVTAAIDAVLPVIEVVETRLLDRQAAGPMWALADNQAHGALILGEAISNWQALSLGEVQVLLRFDDAIIVDRPCHNAGGHPFDMVVKLANQCGAHCDGLRAGQIVTTGSLMGLELAPAGASVKAHITGLGEVAVSFV